MWSVPVDGPGVHGASRNTCAFQGRIRRDVWILLPFVLNRLGDQYLIKSETVERAPC